MASLRCIGTVVVGLGSLLAVLVSLCIAVQSLVFEINNGQFENDYYSVIYYQVCLGGLLASFTFVCLGLLVGVWQEQESYLLFYIPSSISVTFVGHFVLCAYLDVNDNSATEIDLALCECVVALVSNMMVVSHYFELKEKNRKKLHGSITLFEIKPNDPVIIQRV